MFKEYSIQAFGEYAILIKWKQQPSNDMRAYLEIAQKSLQSEFDKEVILTYQELLIKDIIASNDTIERVKKCLDQLDTEQLSTSRREVIIPVCYDLKFGSDLMTLAKGKNKSIDEIIKLHTDPQYIVYFLGFLPGFPYLLGLDEELYTARKKTPSRKVAQGSIAIGGTQTGIYPQDSPGGWHVIGHCPIPLFDIHFPEQSLLRQGDHLQFKAISIDEHVSLSKMSLYEFVNSSFVSNG